MFLIRAATIKFLYPSCQCLICPLLSCMQYAVPRPSSLRSPAKESNPRIANVRGVDGPGFNAAHVAVVGWVRVLIMLDPHCTVQDPVQLPKTFCYIIMIIKLGVRVLIMLNLYCTIQDSKQLPTKFYLILL